MRNHTKVSVSSLGSTALKLLSKQSNRVGSYSFSILSRIDCFEIRTNTSQDAGIQTFQYPLSDRLL